MNVRITVVRDGSLKLVRRSPSGIWYARGKIRGQNVYVSTKTDDAKRAARVAAEIQQKLLEPELHHTFADACASYVKFGGEQQYLPKLLQRLSKRLLTDLRQTDLDEAAAVIHPKVSRETLNRHVYTPFIAVWNHAAGNEWATTRTWRRPRRPKGSAVRTSPTRAGTRPVSYERAWQFVSAMSPAPAMLMTFLFYTGMRPIEVFALRCEDIDVPGRWITVRNTKTGEPRGVPMHEVVVPLLGALVAGGGEVFRTPRGGAYPVTSDKVKGQLNTAIQGARRRLAGAEPPVMIDDVSPYTARHTVSTQLVIEGVHPHIKDQILGHAVDDMSRHYTHVPQAPLIEAINKLPVIPEWRDAPWMTDPLGWRSRLVSPITGGKEEAFIRLREQGMIVKDIAAETGVSPASVFAALRKVGLVGNKRK